MWSNVVEETGEPGENHRTWTGDHYPATCLDPDSDPDRCGDKRQFDYYTKIDKKDTIYKHDNFHGNYNLLIVMKMGHALDLKVTLTKE